MEKVWGKFFSRDPSFVLFKKLRTVKTALKKLGRNASPLFSQLSEAKKEHYHTLAALEAFPSDATLLLNAKEASKRYFNLFNMELSLVAQRAKSHWLTHFNDDLKFLYSSIKER